MLFYIEKTKTNISSELALMREEGWMRVYPLDSRISRSFRKKFPSWSPLLFPFSPSNSKIIGLSFGPSVRLLMKPSLCGNKFIACSILKHAGPSEAVRHGGGRRTKTLQGEREKRGERKSEERKERKGRGEEEGQTYYECKTHPWNCQKIIKDTERGKKKQGKGEKRDREGQRK